MTTTTSSPTARTSAAQVALGVLVAAVMASLGNAVIALLAHAGGASDAFRPLEPTAFVPFTVIGVLLATVGWAVVRRGRRAASTLRWLVPVVLVVSLVPDVLVGLGGSQPGTSWGAVIALMAMHVLVAAVVVTVLTRVLPVSDRA